MIKQTAAAVNLDNSFNNMCSILFGIVALAIGLINSFWGNDPGYGVFVILLSLVYFPPFTAWLKKISGIGIPAVAKLILGAFILWSALGVAELSDKIGLMMHSFQHA